METKQCVDSISSKTYFSSLKESKEKNCSNVLSEFYLAVKQYFLHIVCSQIAHMHRNTEVLQLRKCSLAGKVIRILLMASLCLFHSFRPALYFDTFLFKITALVSSEVKFADRLFLMSVLN